MVTGVLVKTNYLELIISIYLHSLPDQLVNNLIHAWASMCFPNKNDSVDSWLHYEDLMKSMSYEEEEEWTDISHQIDVQISFQLEQAAKDYRWVIFDSVKIKNINFICLYFKLGKPIRRSS